VTRYYPLTVLNPFWIAYFSWSYNATGNGTTELEPVREFVDLFPGAEHQITNFTGDNGQEIWTSTVGLNGRYILSVQVPIRLDWSRRHVTDSGPADYTFQEIESVQAADVVHITTKEYRRFGPAEWKKLYRSHGDLRALGIEVITDRPIAHFDRACRVR
jgi:hypothetical protein